MPNDRDLAGGVSVLLDPHDDAAVTAGLLARHDLAAGRVVVHPTPGSGGWTSLAHDLLGALGAPVGALNDDRVADGRPAWLAAASWITADRVQHLVVLRAHRLHATGWTRLVALARSTGVTLLLVCHTRTIPEPLGATLHGVEHQVLTDLPSLLHDSPTRQHALAQLRGVQAGFLLHGYWLVVPVGDLCGPGLTSIPVTTETVARIRAGVAHPVLAAGIVLALIPVSTRSHYVSYASMRYPHRRRWC